MLKEVLSGCPVTTMLAMCGCFTSVRKLATLAVVVGVFCRLADAANAECGPGFDWTFNNLKQSPCDVTAALGGVCTSGVFSLPSLTPSQIYAGPSAGFDTPCRCNTVYYSTLNACAVCQGAGINPWNHYNVNCTTVYTQLFPSPIPSGFSVPHWAYLDVTTANTFDPALAQAAGGSDSTAVPQATSSTASSTYPSSSGKKTNVGAIAGGVVGGVVGLASIAGIVFWLLRRRRQNASSQPTPGTYDPQLFVSNEKPIMDTMNTGNTGGTAFVSTPPPKLYNPNDPTTFPQYAVPHHTGTTNTSFSAPQQSPYPTHSNFPGNQQMPLGPSGHNQYTGAPEI